MRRGEMIKVIKSLMLEEKAKYEPMSISQSKSSVAAMRFKSRAVT